MLKLWHVSGNYDYFPMVVEIMQYHILAPVMFNLFFAILATFTVCSVQAEDSMDISYGLG